MRRAPLVATGLALGLLLLVLTAWLLTHNLTVDVTAGDLGNEPAGVTGCVIAPYDAGFFGNDQPPGGEHSQGFMDEVASECYTANMTRFKVAMGTGSAALLLVLVGVWTSRRSKGQGSSH